MRLRKSFLGLALLIATMTAYAIEGTAQTAGSDAAKSSATTAVATDRALFTGTYRYAGSPQEEEARKVAIDRAVGGMSFMIRSTARGRITATTQILGSYSFSFEPGKVVVRPEGRPEMVSGDKGEPADYVYNGKTSKLTQVLAGDRITQVFVSDDGERENVFALSADGQRLTLKVSLTSPRLSMPVSYSLSYRKQSE